MQKFIKFFQQNIYLFILVVFCLVFLAINIRMNLFSYNNFDFGKFDLGNMSQMLWTTLHGKFMYLTDYFGTNLPRWAMSHVDPILLLFLPLFAVFPHPLTLVFAQITIVTLSSILIFFVADLKLRSKPASLFIALSFLLYPALGYLTARTGFHGVSAAIPFFIVSFYSFEKMAFLDRYTKKGWIIFWVFSVITMTGKEQLPLYYVLFAVYIYLCHSNFGKKKDVAKNAIALFIVSTLWFVTAFFIIIPKFAHYRIDGYKEFRDQLEISSGTTRAVDLPNYFLSRYDAFGSDYGEIIKNALLNPELVVRVFFGGDKLDSFNKTFMPLLYLPFGSPQIAVFAVPDLLMNYLTSAGGIGTSEITNHRISMIIPVLFISSIFTLALIKLLLDNKPKIQPYVVNGLAAALFVASLYTSHLYNNPVYLWARDALKKRLPQFIAEAKTDSNYLEYANAKIGDVIKFSPLENKDRECAANIVKSIPAEVTVSGPDYLGAHLSLRHTYAIFPALYNQADYVIVDVFSRKILTILDLDPSLIKNVINKLVRDPNYELQQSCSNLFVFKRVTAYEKTAILPIQEKYRSLEKTSYEIYAGLKLVDYTLPKEIKRNSPAELKYTYLVTDKITDYFLYTTLINVDTGKVFQNAHLPSFAILEPAEWNENHYYLETVDIAVPEYFEPGVYKAFVGMSNNIKVRNLYLGEILVK